MTRFKYKVDPRLKEIVEKHISPMFTEDERRELDKAAKFLGEKLRIREACVDCGKLDCNCIEGFEVELSVGNAIRGCGNDET